MMSDVHYIFIQTAAASATSPGAIAEGWFVIRDGKVVLTGADGKIWQGAPDREIKDGETAEVVAKRLLRSRQTKSGFNRPLSYPEAGVA
jgi:hypothetical protein